MGRPTRWPNHSPTETAPFCSLLASICINKLSLKPWILETLPALCYSPDLMVHFAEDRSIQTSIGMSWDQRTHLREESDTHRSPRLKNGCHLGPCGRLARGPSAEHSRFAWEGQTIPTAQNLRNLGQKILSGGWFTMVHQHLCYKICSNRHVKTADGSRD